MASISSLPTECLLLIFESCDELQQVLDLSKTCKRLHAIYFTNVHSLFYPLARKEIFAFDDAVLTVRATQVVVDHYKRDELPPTPFPFGSLSLEARKLSPRDAQEVLKWNMLIDCIDHICSVRTTWGETLESPEQRQALSRQGRDGRHEWRERFHRSIYRSFLLGAVLCRAYQEPFFAANESDLLSRFLVDRPSEEDSSRLTLTSAEMAHFLEYPIFNFEEYDKHGPVYGDLAEFLVEQSKTRPLGPIQEQQEHLYPWPSTPSLPDTDHANVMFAETIQCFFASLVLNNHQGHYPILRDKHKRIYPWMPGVDVTVILFGSFYPENIRIPARSLHSMPSNLTKLPFSRKRKVSQGHIYCRSLDSILPALQRDSGQPNEYAPGYPTPPPPLQVFQYILRRYLDVCFAHYAFREDDGGPNLKFLMSIKNRYKMYFNDYYWWPAHLSVMLRADGEAIEEEGESQSESEDEFEDEGSSVEPATDL